MRDWRGIRPCFENRNPKKQVVVLLQGLSISLPKANPIIAWRRGVTPPLLAVRNTQREPTKRCGGGIVTFERFPITTDEADTGIKIPKAFGMASRDAEPGHLR